MNPSELPSTFVTAIRLLTRQMAANGAVAQDLAGNRNPAEDKSTERIDGIVALIMAIGRAMVAQEEPQPHHDLPSQI